MLPAMRLPGVVRCGSALAWLLPCACWQPTGRIDYVVPQPSRAPPPVAGILSAHFSRDAQRDHTAADAIVVVFDRELDASSLVGRAFMVVLSDGSRVRADAAVLAPASEADENRTVMLWGEFGAPEGPTPTDVVVIDRIWDEAGGPLLGASGKVSAYADGPRLVAVHGLGAPQSGACGGAGQVVRTYWSDEVDDVGDDDLPRIDVELADGRTVHPTGFDDTVENGTDVGDDNVLDLCLAEAIEPRVLRIDAGVFAGPAGPRSATGLATIVAVAGDSARAQ
jgi:hypothetical protein